MWRISVVWGIVLFGYATALGAARAPAPFVSTLKLSDAAIWMAPPQAIPSVHYPTSAVLTVEVRDTHGQLLDGIPVEFAIEPAWAEDASLSPRRALTKGGRAHTTFRAWATGLVRVQARVGTTTHEAVITIYPPYYFRETGSD